MHLLHVRLGILLHVLGKAVLDALLQLFDNLAARVADAHLGLLSLLAALLGKLLAALLRQGRYAQTDNLAVVLGRDADVAVHDGLLDGAEHALVPRLDGNGTRIGRVDGCHLVQGDHASVAVDTDAIQNLDVGLTGTDVCQSFFEVQHSLVHFLLGFAKRFLYVYHISACLIKLLFYLIF